MKCEGFEVIQPICLLTRPNFMACNFGCCNLKLSTEINIDLLLINLSSATWKAISKVAKDMQAMMAYALFFEACKMSHANLQMRNQILKGVVLQPRL